MPNKCDSLCQENSATLHSEDIVRITTFGNLKDLKEEMNSKVPYLPLSLHGRFNKETNILNFII